MFSDNFESIFHGSPQNDAIFGEATLKGGAGNDDLALTHSLEDTIRFETGYNEPTLNGINTADQTLADIFGPGALADTADNATIDWLNFDVWTNARGHTVFHCYDTTVDGDVIDETVRVRNLTESQIDLALIDYINYDLF